MLSRLKRELGYAYITDDEKTTLNELAEEALVYLRRYHPGVSSDDVLVKGLIVEYVRYALSNARDDFPVNYGRELRSLHNQWRKANVKQDDQDGE